MNDNALNVENLPEKPETDRGSEQPAPPKKRSVFRRFLWPLIKIPLYTVFIVGITVFLLWGIEKAAGLVLAKSHYGVVYPGRPEMIRKDFTRVVSHYDYDFNPGVCLEYNVAKGNRYEYSNNAGFREPLPIPLEKPADEYRIFLTGGSTAYGMGAIGELTSVMGHYTLEYRETISHLMEMILNATAPIPGKKIRVYNTAVWGYAYQHLLMRYMVKLRRYSPDAIISLDGANELPIICKLNPDLNYYEEGQFQSILSNMYAYNGQGLSSYLTLWLKNNTYLMSYIWHGRDTFQELGREGIVHKGAAPATSVASKPQVTVEEASRIIDRNVGDVVRTVENYHSALENDGVYHIVALQPWLYLSKKPQHEKEKAALSIPGHRQYYGVPSDRVYDVLMRKMHESSQQKGYMLLQFTDYFDDVNEWVFTDWCHLTAGANYLLAKELAGFVKQHALGMPLTDSDKVTDKDEYFFDLAASGSIKYAPPGDGIQTSPQNILRTYPGPPLYASREPADGEPLEVVLDLGEALQISRLRFVWADESSVPSKWVAEYSMDGKDWSVFIESGATQPDAYSQWPGVEYYAAEPVKAHYFRYRPLDPEKKTIRMRLWSLYR